MDFKRLPKYYLVILYPFVEFNKNDITYFIVLNGTLTILVHNNPCRKIILKFLYIKYGLVISEVFKSN